MATSQVDPLGGKSGEVASGVVFQFLRFYKGLGSATGAGPQGDQK